MTEDQRYQVYRYAKKRSQEIQRGTKMEPKKYGLEYKGGWAGGHFSIRDLDLNVSARFSFKEQPKATILIRANQFPALYTLISGSDYDHGHHYQWSMTDIGIKDGNIVPRFLSVREILKAGFKVYITFGEK